MRSRFYTSSVNFVKLCGNKWELGTFMKFFFAIFLICRPVYALNSTACNSVEDGYEAAVSYWPYDVICAYLRENSNNCRSDALADKPECKIATNGDKIETKLCEVASLNYSGVYDFQLTMNGSSCANQSAFIDVQPFSNSTCRQFVNANGAIHIEATYGDIVKLLCRPNGNFGEFMLSSEDQNEYLTEWNMNCGSRDHILRRMNKFARKEADPGYPESLVITGVDFYNSGELTCSVSSRGRALYVVTYSLCIKRRPGEINPTISCTGEKKIDRGGTVVFDCTSPLPSGITKDGEFFIEWMKEGNVVCRSSSFNQTTLGEIDDRFSCIAKSNNNSLVCETFGSEPTQTRSKSVTAEMKLSGADSSDFVNYEAHIRFRNQTESDTIKLTEDLIPFFEKITTILLVCLVLLFLGVVIIVTYKKNELFFDLLMIKIIGRYNSEGKELFLSYLFLNYQPEEERRLIMKIYHIATNSTLCFDVAHQRNPSQGMNQENLANRIANCHSSLLVIGRDYVNNEESNHEADLAFNRLMKNKARVLLVVLPEGKKNLSDAARKNEVWKRIYIASKVFDSFTWRPEAADDVNERELRTFITTKLPGDEFDEHVFHNHRVQV